VFEIVAPVAVAGTAIAVVAMCIAVVAV